ncbi:MAG: trehalose-6-phosphate synthase [Chloroflexi bacterium]|jgi:trehalose 6-phosphate synthase|nr:trehalose-6-phosphate synthase [Chloroflexota bacterium]MBT7081625.1 trehalose-6-phosphate synthase [Chloroflexota bacterium]MBT7288955.1 trehalose-6-phosphate synthase [Chloroflexota bacterium]
MFKVPGTSNHTKLVELCLKFSAERKLFLASNRGPVEFRIGPNDHLHAQRGGGGLVTALSAACQHIELTWFASALGEGDRRAVYKAGGNKLNVPLIGPKTYLNLIISPRNVYHKYYNIFSNPLLWFLQHYMWNTPYTPNIDAKVYDAWENGYVKVNKAFADEIIAEAGKDSKPPIVLIHDYQLYLVAGYLRKAIPNAIIVHFTHIPWPAHSYWQLLPPHMRHAIMESMCSCDIVGLQTMRDVPNFMLTCEALLPDADINFRNHTITLNGHTTQVNAYPISVDVAGLEKLAKSAWIDSYRSKLKPLFGQKTIVRVDRTEPSKNIVRGFKAYDVMLSRHPELIGKVKFLAFLVPSRTRIKQYQRYNEEVLELVKLVNGKYGTDSWQPIVLFYENNYPQAIAALCLYDVLLVNAVIDGMNLVAKEGPIVNRRDGVLVLSESVGAYGQLKEGALAITPVDTECTAKKLYEALMMPSDERAKRANILQTQIKKEDLDHWMCSQFEDINALLTEQATPKAVQHQLLPVS